MLFLGFGSGLPFYLVYGTLSAWLRQEHIVRGTSACSRGSAAFHLEVPMGSDRRSGAAARSAAAVGAPRSWMFLAQLGVVAALVNLSTAHPATNLMQVALGALFLAFCSATQDIAMDAWRIESAPGQEQGAMAAAYQLGYRLAIISSTFGALQIAEAAGWHASYATMAGLGLVGVITTLLVREPPPRPAAVGEQQEQRVRDWLASRSHWPQFARTAGRRIHRRGGMPVDRFSRPLFGAHRRAAAAADGQLPPDRFHHWASWPIRSTSITATVSARSPRW